MCGIAGIVSASPPSDLEPLVRAMGERLVHRGPDAGATWRDPRFGACFAHRRLAILGLGPEGAQPMHGAGGRLTLVYNGEVYNFRALRAELESLGHGFRGHSDTETLLAAFAEWGVLEALKRANGMFAFALWDRETRQLTLGRDRMGQKPLYYGWVGRHLVFASELKSFRALPFFDADIDRSSLAGYLRFNAVGGTASIYRGVSKLEPGGIRTFDFGASARPRGDLERYWDLGEVAARAAEDRITDPVEAVEELERRLARAVTLRLESDVPLGAFLSGGIDSTAIVALMQAHGSSAARTFTIGFHEPDQNEATFAKEVAAHLGTIHTERYLTAEDARAVIPLLPSMFDEPFCDASQIPTYLVSKVAREHVTVALSGDAGDELFLGYPRYPFTHGVHRRIQRAPEALRRAAGATLRRLPPSAFMGLERLLRPVRNTPVGRRINIDRLLLLRELLGHGPSTDLFYRSLHSTWREAEGPTLDVPNEVGVNVVGMPDPPPVLDTMIERSAFLDMVGYLPDDILVKVDRASMAVSLEARSPMLDPGVVELACRMPLDIKLRDGRQKWPLQQLVWKHVPRALMDRPKQGFGVPMDRWLRGPLREWAEDLLDEARLRREGFFDPAPVRRRLREHLDGTRSWAPELWAVLMFEAWLDAS